jgi:hypothetical protein
MAYPADNLSSCPLLTLHGTLETLKTILSSKKDIIYACIFKSQFLPHALFTSLAVECNKGSEGDLHFKVLLLDLLEAGFLNKGTGFPG